MLIVSGCLSACATTTNSASEEDSEAPDSFEKFNRSMFAVNRFGDKVVYKPFSKGYEAVVPSFARKGVYNFFDNLKTPRSSVNNFLQGKPGRGFSELARFFFNSTLGVGTREVRQRLTCRAGCRHGPALDSCPASTIIGTVSETAPGLRGQG